MQSPQWYAPPAPDPLHGLWPQQLDPRAGPPPEPAGFGIRVGARVIDAIVNVVAGAVGGGIGGFILGALSVAGVIGNGWQHNIKAFAIGSIALGMVGTTVCSAIAEGLGGATLGKLACGLRVLRDDYGPCTFGKALGRNAAYYIDALFFGLIAWGSMSKSPAMQRYGDRWAGTVVVKASSLSMPVRSPAVGIIVAFGVSLMFHLGSALMKAL
jgi:uncharacterized RDD family membrane protein YckC